MGKDWLTCPGSVGHASTAGERFDSSVTYTLHQFWILHLVRPDPVNHQLKPHCNKNAAPCEAASRPPFTWRTASATAPPATGSRVRSRRCCPAGSLVRDSTPSLAPR